MPSAKGEPVYTVGHSNRSLGELVELIDARGIRTLVDVRRNPWSRRHPHFCKPALERSFEGLAARYVHKESLGGMRTTTAESPNGALPEALRGYADHMASREFASALDEALALGGPLAFMCAEALPSSCHRSLLCDELVRRGLRVLHILGAGRESVHRIDPRAVDEGGRLIYPSRSSFQIGLPLT